MKLIPKKETLRMTMLLGVVITLSTFIATSSITNAYAVSPNFHGTCFVDVKGKVGTVTCTGKITGLGNLDDQFVYVQLFASATATCYNPANNQPTGQQGGTAESPIQKVNIDREGNIQYSQTATFTFEGKCQGAHTLCFDFGAATIKILSQDGQQTLYTIPTNIDPVEKCNPPKRA